MTVGFMQCLNRTLLQISIYLSRRTVKCHRYYLIISLGIMIINSNNASLALFYIKRNESVMSHTTGKKHG